MENDRPMFEGKWQCSGCSSTITKLPFQPRSEANLLCRDCHANKRQSEGGGAGPRPERQMHQGNWQCAGCGNAITQLPFQPRETGNLKCLDCFKASRA